MTIRVNYKFSEGVRKLLLQEGGQKLVKQGVRDGLRAGAFKGQELAKGFAPYKSGTLRRSIMIKEDFSESVDIVYVGIDGKLIPYAQIQEEGGVIVAKNKPNLKFKINGQWFSKKSVTIKPKRYMAKAYSALKNGVFQKIMDSEISRLIQ